jgi:hypothetical protein
VTHPYQYVTLRCVPRVDRGEFVNVGVVLFSQSADVLTCRWHLDEGRLLSLAPSLDLEALRAALATIEQVCAGVTGGGLPDLDSPGRRFGWIAAPRSTVLQPGPRHGGQCADPVAAIDQLMTRLVLPEATE